MKFESVFNASATAAVDNPATTLAKSIFTHGKTLALVSIEVRKRGRSYRDLGQSYVVTHDEDLGEQELRAAARELAEELVDICAKGQSQYDSAVDWRITGYNEPDKGSPKKLFEETFKVAPKELEHTLKETETTALTESNKLLRLIAEDQHKNLMAVTAKMIEMITPVATMAGNIAEKVRPSDAEMTHRTRMAEMELEAAVAKAEAVGRQARSQATNETVRYIFDQMPMDELGEAAKLYAQHLIEKHRAEQAEARRRAKAERDKTRTTQEDPTVSSTATNPTTDQATSGATSQDSDATRDNARLCEGSQTLSDIIEGRRDALAAGLGDVWQSFEPLAQQTDQEAFDRLAAGIYEDFSSRPKAELLTLFTKMNVALADDDDPARMDRLQAFLKDSGILK